MAFHNEVTTLFLIVLVGIGDIIWLVTDPRSRKERQQRKISLTYPRVTLALLPQVAIGLMYPWPSTSWNGIFAILGIGVVLLGLGLALWTRAVMGPYWAPPDNHDIVRQGRLITRAPFSFTRNPIYVTACLIVLGFAIAVRSGGIILVIALFLSLRKSVLREETLLEGHFGEQYKKYKTMVPRFLLV